MEVVYLMMLFGFLLIGIGFFLIVEGEKKTKKELQGEENDNWSKTTPRISRSSR